MQNPNDNQALNRLIDDLATASIYARNDSDLDGAAQLLKRLVLEQEEQAAQIYEAYTALMMNNFVKAEEILGKAPSGVLAERDARMRSEGGSAALKRHGINEAPLADWELELLSPPYDASDL